MDVEKSFTFSFEDREWLSKLGLGALISLIPILNFAWTGYMVQIIRNVMDDAPELLPAWDDLEKKFMDGLILFAAGVLYALPMLVLIFLPLSVTLFSGVLSGQENLEEIGQIVTGAGGLVFFCMLGVGLLYGLVLSVLYPVILLLYAREGTFASCFKLGEAIALIRRNPAAYLTAWGLSLLAGIGVGLLIGFVNMVVGFVPCIGWIIGLVLSLGSGVYISSVASHLFGQFGRTAWVKNQVIPVT